MAYLLILAVVGTLMLLLNSKLEKGWNRNNTSASTRSSTQKVLGVIGIVICIFLINTYNDLEKKWNEYQQTSETKKKEEQKLASIDSLKTEFQTNKKSILCNIQQIQTSGDLAKAKIEALKYTSTKDKDILALIAELDAAILDKNNKQIIDESTAALAKLTERDTYQKLTIYSNLVAAAPQNQEYKVKLAFYEKRVAIEGAIAEEKATKARMAEKKKLGVHIGMTMQDVKDSSWGRPSKVNRTSTLNRVHEQWVYGVGSYLYFEDGILTAIQN